MGNTEALMWIIGSGLGMSLLALVGGFSLFLSDESLHKIILPLVAFSAGSLLGGAFFHLIPMATTLSEDAEHAYLFVMLGFALFFALEQFLHWHHCHRSECGDATANQKKPLGYLILVGDGIHNLLGGLAVGSAFLIDIRLGIATWLAAAMHEIPQEMGDFGALIHSGWSKAQALGLNLLSSTTFLVGGIIAYLASGTFNLNFLIPLAAGNFIYIAASDLVPEVNRHYGLKLNLLHFGAFMLGVMLLFFVRDLGHSH